jgi:hypothetical protein
VRAGERACGGVGGGMTVSCVAHLVPLSGAEKLHTYERYVYSLHVGRGERDGPLTQYAPSAGSCSPQDKTRGVLDIQRERVRARDRRRKGETGEGRQQEAP